MISVIKGDLAQIRRGSHEQYVDFRSLDHIRIIAARKRGRDLLYQFVISESFADSVNIFAVRRKDNVPVPGRDLPGELFSDAAEADYASFDHRYSSPLF